MIPTHQSNSGYNNQSGNGFPPFALEKCVRPDVILIPKGCAAFFLELPPFEFGLFGGVLTGLEDDI